MKKEDKDLLLRDLCARLPYGVKILHEGWNYEWDDELSTVERVVGIDDKFVYTKVINTHNGEEYRDDKHTISLFDDKIFLRPMSSMTEEERHEIQEILGKDVEIPDDFIHIIDSSRKSFSFIEIQAVFDYLSAHHFDYRGLIKKGLAIEASKDVYNEIKEE